MPSDIARDLCKRGDKLFELREPWLAFWQELADQFYPQRADFTEDQTWGEEYGTHLFDEGPVVMRRDLANAVPAMIRPRGQVWFKPEPIDDRLLKDKPTADYLEMIGKVQRQWMYEPRANFVRATNECDHDFVSFGNGVLTVELNRHRTGLMYRCWHLRDCAWAENADGVSDTMHRVMVMTARQMRQMFGEKALHANIKKACETDPEKTFKVRHVMLPYDDYEYIDGANKKKFRKFPFVSAYLDLEHNEILREAGSYEFRYVIPRWQTISGSPYAVSPATSDSLPGARQLQTMARTGNEALEKSIDPPAKITEHAIRGDVNLFAGGLTWVDKSYDEKLGAAMELFDVGKNAILALNAIDAQRMRLMAATFVSKLNLPEQAAKMTAFETQKRVEEYVREVMPLVEPWETNYSAQLLDETYSVLSRVGAFGSPEDIPDALSNGDFKWTFINPLQDTMKRVKMNILTNALGIIGAASQVDPGAASIIDIVTAARDAIRGDGAPEDWIRDEDDADALTQAHQQIAQLQQVIAGATAAGEAAGAVGEGVSKLGEAVTGAREAIAA